MTTGVSERYGAVGLITTARSGRAEVSDFKREAGLEVLGMMAEHARGGDESTRYMISVLEMRALERRLS